MTRKQAIDLWEMDFMESEAFDYPDIEVIIEYVESRGYKVKEDFPYE